MTSTTHIELSPDAVRNNFHLIRKIVGPKVRISSVIKANAYGHGLKCYLPLAESCGIDHFSVFSAKEAKAACEIKQQNTDIMIMGAVNRLDIPWIIKSKVELYIFDEQRLASVIAAAKRQHTKACIHLEVETGMNRTGIPESSLERVAELIKTNYEYLEIKGICTHFAGAESIANYARIMKQIGKFNRIVKWFQTRDIVPDMIHSACSAAVITYPRTRYDMVRIGILQYGFWPSREVFIQYISRKKITSDPFIRVLSWKSYVMSVKKVSRGEFVSYGTSFLAQDHMVIALIPVGYSSGYSRSLSNQGRVLIHGRRSPVIGTVNMNMMIVNVSMIENVQPGDEVVLIGKQGDMEITVASFSEFNDQLNYELLARLPAGIRRTIQ